MITYDVAITESDLHQILELQQQNLTHVLLPDEIQSQGFVTVEHSFDVLKSMNDAYPHTIARAGNYVIGYALVMSRNFADEVPILKPMFDIVNSIHYKNELLKDANYIVMGQVCIAKSYRGKGVFAGMYNKMKDVLENKFHYIITEVAQANTRSLRAHIKMGFKDIFKYIGPTGEKWVVLLWELHKNR